ncbi:Cu(I)-responsive transcriptional regulator [Sandarakinorhabdus sp.]|uniref:Cu(I)-responsive transcriptional regulator n=1 Tax=Sandarakinorhabdus sp. TaxID=1916663 RepID=UPI00286E48C1|nr:Cu(I)-responsive transcriptional regulator [Sandarakinorhabdus sp.]
MNIGEAAAAAGLSARMVRHYEKIGLTPRALRRDSQYRDYSANDVHRLRFIARARDLGFPLSEIGELLALWGDQTRASADVKALAIGRIADLRERERALHAMRHSLEHLVAACSGDTRPDCPIIEDIAGRAG